MTHFCKLVRHLLANLVFLIFVFQFEQENKKLFEEMNSLVSEVRQIEGKVVEISRLQEIFADKILEQVRTHVVFEGCQIFKSQSTVIKSWSTAFLMTMLR